MSIEADHRALHAKAEQIHASLITHDGLDQLQEFKKQLDLIDNPAHREAIQLLVWSWIKDGRESSNFSSTEIFSSNHILIGCFLTVALICWLEFGLSWIWSIAFAFFVSSIVKIILRIFDRGFFFRRSFTACVTTTLLLIIPAQLQFSWDTPFGNISWGGEPASGVLTVLAVLCLLTFAGAVIEHRSSKKVPT